MRARAETFLHDRLVTHWMATWRRGEQSVTRQAILARLGMPGVTCDASSSPGPLSETQIFQSHAAPVDMADEQNFGRLSSNRHASYVTAVLAASARN
jgi:hypothetical protein